MEEVMETEFCGCGLVKGHKGKCLSIKMEHKELIGKYSGQSKREYGAYERF